MKLRKTCKPERLKVFYCRARKTSIRHEKAKQQTATVHPLKENIMSLKIHSLPSTSLEHRRIEQALILVYKSIYSQAPNYIQELFFLRGGGYNLRGHLKVVLPRPTSFFLQHSFTYQVGKQWNNLPNKIRMSESLYIFRKNLQSVQLSSSYNCNCAFCT